MIFRDLSSYAPNICQQAQVAVASGAPAQLINDVAASTILQSCVNDQLLEAQTVAGLNAEAAAGVLTLVPTTGGPPISVSTSQTFGPGTTGSSSGAPAAAGGFSLPTDPTTLALLGGGALVLLLLLKRGGSSAPAAAPKAVSGYRRRRRS